MVKLNRIYTRKGDGGMTSLVGGDRRPKHDLRIAAYGSVDETNAVIGIARLATRDKAGDQADGEADAMLARIQHDLFDLGADLATPAPPGDDPDFANDKALRVTGTQVARLEAEIDRMNAALSPLTSFTLPGGGAAAAYLHLGRTVARRAEREICALAAREAVNPTAISYINRLSDHLFVLSRHLNDDGATDVLWVPGANR